MFTTGLFQSQNHGFQGAVFVRKQFNMWWIYAHIMYKLQKSCRWIFQKLVDDAAVAVVLLRPDSPLLHTARNSASYVMRLQQQNSEYTRVLQSCRLSNLSSLKVSKTSHTIHILNLSLYFLKPHQTVTFEIQCLVDINCVLSDWL